jgi:hypothetical protein
MKKLRNWAALVALTIFVAGAVALEAQPTGWLSHFTNASSGTVQFRALSSYGRPVLIGFGTAVPTAANDGAPPMDGEVFVVNADSTAPDIQVYDANGSAWDTIARLDVNAQTWTPAQTFTAAATFNGDVTFGTATSAAAASSDAVNINGRVSQPLIYEDFEQTCYAYQNDGTTASGTDTEINTIHCPGSGFYATQRIEIAATLPLWDTSQDGYWDLSGDITADDGHMIAFAPNAATEMVRVATSPTTFVEASFTITDISAFDGDWFFGWNLVAALPDTPQHDGFNTYAGFTIQDNAGDTDIECDVDGGGEAAVTAGITWADGATHVLRVTLEAAGGYLFYVAGTLVAAATCVSGAANEATDGDLMVPVYYHTQGAEGAATGVQLNYYMLGRDVQ